MTNSFWKLCFDQRLLSRWVWLTASLTENGTNSGAEKKCQSVINTLQCWPNKLTTIPASTSCWRTTTVKPQSPFRAFLEALKNRAFLESVRLFTLFSHHSSKVCVLAIAPKNVMPAEHLPSPAVFQSWSQPPRSRFTWCIVIMEQVFFTGLTAFFLPCMMDTSMSQRSCISG